MAINLDRIQAPKLEAPTLSTGGSLAPNTTYYYCVVAMGGSDSLSSYQHYFESPRSNIVEVTTDETNKTVNLNWNIPTISQSGSLAGNVYDNYAVLRSTDRADLEGRENVPILINTSYTQITTTTNSFTDDNVTGGTADGIKSYFWYRPHGCPKIHLEGTDSTHPYTMKQLYDADLAGTLELLPEVEATDTPHRLYTPVNPADSKQLALDIVVTNYTSAGSVELLGKDAGGDSKSETISITGDGTYTSTLTYASIDEGGIICTGDFTLKIIQNRWGFIEPHRYQLGDNNGKLGAQTWTIHCSFYNETYFLTKRESIFIAGGFNPGMNYDAHFVAGELDASGGGRDGSYINFHNRRWFAGMNSGLITQMELYASLLQYGGNGNDMYAYPGSSATWMGGADWRTNPNGVKFIDSIFDMPSGGNGFLVNASFSPELNRGLFVGDIQPRTDSSTYDYGGMTLVKGKIAHQIDEHCEHQNLNIITTSDHIYYWSNNSQNYTYKNLVFMGIPEAEPFNEPYYSVYPNYTNKTTGTFKNDFNVKVVDLTGELEGAVVNLVRSDGTDEGSVLTDGSGNASLEAIYSTTVIDRGSLTGSLSGYATNNRGNLSPVNPAVVATNYTHTLTISKPGYQTYTSELDMSSKKDLVIKLEKAVDAIIAKGQIAINTDPNNPQSDFYV